MIVLDGGMGRELARAGAPFRQSEWAALALMEEPSAVRAAHDRFAAAGADVLTTNAYAVVPYHIGEERFSERGSELAALAGRLARKAADAADHPCRVAASIPPLFGSYLPQNFDAVRARQLWPVIIGAQLPYSDILLIETLSSIEETVTALGLCRGKGKPVWVSATLSDDESLLRSGESAARWLKVVREADPGDVIEAVLFNCSQPEVMADAVAEATMARGTATWQIGVYANAFPKQPPVPTPNESLFDLRQDLTPSVYADFAQSWRDRGAGIIGGCCGVGPEFIAELRKIA